MENRRCCRLSQLDVIEDIPNFSFIQYNIFTSSLSLTCLRISASQHINIQKVFLGHQFILFLAILISSFISSLSLNSFIHLTRRSVNFSGAKRHHKHFSNCRKFEGIRAGLSLMMVHGMQNISLFSLSDFFWHFQSKQNKIKWKKKLQRGREKGWN